MEHAADGRRFNARGLMQSGEMTLGQGARKWVPMLAAIDRARSGIMRWSESRADW
jgi:hypothetical protein